VVLGVSYRNTGALFWTVCCTCLLRDVITAFASARPVVCQYVHRVMTAGQHSGINMCQPLCVRTCKRKVNFRKECCVRNLRPKRAVEELHARSCATCFNTQSPALFPQSAGCFAFCCGSLSEQRLVHCTARISDLRRSTVFFCGA
jgi:hypothetical protein